MQQISTDTTNFSVSMRKQTHLGWPERELSKCKVLVNCSFKGAFNKCPLIVNNKRRIHIYCLKTERIH